MYDSTPPPFGSITRRWTHLADLERDDHTRRLTAGACAGENRAHVDRVVLDDGACYHRLVPAALAGDEVALGWLATTHRPLLITRGRALFDHDPSEWGAVCLELLHTTLANADLGEVRWLRRRVAQQLAARLSRHVARHLDRRHREAPTAPGALRASCGRVEVCEPQLEVALVLDHALEQLDAPTRDALVALANHQLLARSPTVTGCRMPPYASGSAAPADACAPPSPHTAAQPPDAPRNPATFSLALLAPAAARPPRPLASGRPPAPAGHHPLPHLTPTPPPPPETADALADRAAHVAEERRIARAALPATTQRLAELAPQDPGHQTARDLLASWRRTVARLDRELDQLRTRRDTLASLHHRARR